MLLVVLQAADRKAEREGKLEVFQKFPRKASILNMPLITTLYYCCFYHYNEPEVRPRLGSSWLTGRIWVSWPRSAELPVFLSSGNLQQPAQCPADIQGETRFLSFLWPLTSAAVANAVPQISEKQYFTTALAARAKLKNWMDVDAMFNSRNWLGFSKKKSPLSFQRVVDILQKNSAPTRVSGRSTIMFMMPTTASRFNIQSVLPHLHSKYLKLLYDYILLNEIVSNSNLIGQKPDRITFCLVEQQKIYCWVVCRLQSKNHWLLKKIFQISSTKLWLVIK